MSSASYLKNKDFFTKDKDVALTFTISPDANEQQKLIFNIRKEDDVTVIETKENDPALLLQADPDYPGAWEKASFAKLGNTPEISLVKEAEKRFGLPYNQIVNNKRTIGAMTTLAFVFDDSSVKIVAVQRTSKGHDGTPNMGALSRFGGGVCGGSHGKGVHGAQNLGNQTVREFFEEFHPYIKSPESKILVPIDIVPQGYELDGLKGEFMRAAMDTRMQIAKDINSNLSKERYTIGARKTFRAVPLSISGLTKPLIQIIDGKEVCHENVVAFDAQATNKNLDFNTDMIFAVRIQGVSPKDFLLKDGETDQKTGALLDRIVFFGAPEELKRSVMGEIIKLHHKSDMYKPATYSPAFKPILLQSDKIKKAALNRLK